MLQNLIKQVVTRQIAKSINNKLQGSQAEAAGGVGGNAIWQVIQNQVGGGNLGAIEQVFSGNDDDLASNPIFDSLQEKLTGAIQSNGFSAEEARQQAQTTAPELIKALKDRFQSQAEEDKGFDLSQIANLVAGAGGNQGGLGNAINIAKDLLGK